MFIMPDGVAIIEKEEKKLVFINDKYSAFETNFGQNKGP